ncbi:MAG UNVERIFIED_CONTAM: hypothetical protein LVR18_47070 [Planctomycetaceae bacterium]|jgi:hypothetical protein
MQTLLQILPQILRKSAFIPHHPEAFRVPTECRSQQPRQYRFTTTGILGDDEPLVRRNEVKSPAVTSTPGGSVSHFSSGLPRSPTAHAATTAPKPAV